MKVGFNMLVKVPLRFPIIWWRNICATSLSKYQRVLWRWVPKKMNYRYDQLYIPSSPQLQFHINRAMQLNPSALNILTDHVLRYSLFKGTNIKYITGEKINPRRRSPHSRIAKYSWQIYLSFHQYPLISKSCENIGKWSYQNIIWNNPERHRRVGMLVDDIPFDSIPIETNMLMWSNIHYSSFQLNKRNYKDLWINLAEIFVTDLLAIGHQLSKKRLCDLMH